MITGKVQGQEARIRLRVRGLRGRERDIEAVIDTGFTGALTLPAALIQALHLRWQHTVRGNLADGSECLLDVVEASVVWDRRARRVLAIEAGAVPLVGMELLSGYELNMHVRSRGRVTIKRLP